MNAPLIASGVIAGAGLATGVVFAVMAASDHSKYTREPNNDVALSGERNAFIADVSFGVAALFGLTAIALYLLPDEPSPDEPAKAAVAGSASRRSRHRSWLSSALKGEVLRF